MSHHTFLQVAAATIAAMFVAFLAGFIFRDWLSRYAWYRLRKQRGRH
jgi:membrane-associated phospholipid phosphatase